KPVGGSLVLASPGSGPGGNNYSDTPVLDANGDTLLYESQASNLAGNDTNGFNFDVFAAQALTLSINNVIGGAPASGSTTFTFTVNLAIASAQTVTVQYATSNGTAHQPTDYLAQSGTITFNPGVTSRPINITINQFNAVHPPQTFFVTLNMPAGAAI